MRILVYLLSLLMVFAPTYSAYASVINKGQIIQMGKKGGALVKTGAGVAVKVGKVGRSLTPVGVMGWCVANKKKCKEYAGDAYEIICDISGVCTVERKEDDNPENQCGIYTSATRHGKATGYTAYEACSGALQLFPEYTQSMHVAQVDYPRKPLCAVSGTNKNDFTYKKTPLLDYTFTPCTEEQKKDRSKLSEDELKQLAKKIADQMDDDDIKNYHNTDYDDITINNYHYYGDDIDNQTNIDNQCQNNSCNEISKEIEKDIANKKYGIDDVNEKNCTIEESTGKYIACNMTIKEGDENTQTPPKKEDDDPLSCDSSKFHKKVCDWMDWTQDDDLQTDKETKVDAKDLSDDLKIDDDRVKFGSSCLAGETVSFSFVGQTVSHTMSYQGLCDALIRLKPFVIGTAYIIGAMIIGGRRV